MEPKTRHEDKITQEFTQQVLAEIKLEEQRLVKSRPVLGVFTCRMPLGVKRQLKKAAKKHETDMTLIVMTALRRLLPTLIEDEDWSSPALDFEDQR